MCQGLRQDSLQSYHELREDLRELTLRVKVVEQSNEAAGVQSRDLDDLRADFGRMRDVTDKFAQEQTEAIRSLQQGIHRIKFELGVILLGFK